MGKKHVKSPRKERDHRVGTIVDVEHPGDNRRARRARGINNNPVAQKRAMLRAKAAAEAEAAEKEALDKDSES